MYTRTLTRPLDARQEVYRLAAQAVDDQGAAGLSRDVAFRVEPANEAPVVEDVRYQMLEDGSLNWSLTASDANGDALAIAIVDEPIAGELLDLNQNPGENVLTGTYLPPLNLFGEITFTYEASDGALSSEVGTVTIQVLPVNDHPYGSLPALDVLEDSAPTVVDLAGAFDDVDDGAAALTFSVLETSNPELLDPHLSGSLLTLNYRADANGSGAVTIRATDPPGAFVDAILAVRVQPVNDAPEADAADWITDEDTELSGTLTGSDRDGDSLSYTAVDLPSHGAVSIATDGSFSYLPDDEFNGSDRFTFTVSDGSLSSVPAVVTITVSAVNDAPRITSAPPIRIDEDVAYRYTVLTSDVDVGDTVTVSADSLPHWLVLEDGVLSGTPTNAEVGDHAVRLTATDSDGATATQAFTITVIQVNDAPLADPASFTRMRIPTCMLPSAAAMRRGIRCCSRSKPCRTTGALVLTPEGSFTYTPNADFHGADRFTFRVNDGSLASAPALVQLTVAPVNDAPVAHHDAATTDEDRAVVVDVLANDTDVDGDPLAIRSVEAVLNGSAVIHADQTVTFSPAPGYFGPAGFIHRSRCGWCVGFRSGEHHGHDSK